MNFHTWRSISPQTTGLIRTTVLVMMASMASSCSSYRVAYQFEGSGTSPTIEFTSDYLNHTSLSANTTDTVVNRCKDLKAVGYILKSSHKPFSMDEVNTLVKFRVPENQPVIVNAWAMISATANSSTSCGPIAVRFTPAPGKVYKINFTQDGTICHMPISTADGEKIEATYLSTCR